MLTILTAFCGQARTQSPQARQIEGSAIGGSKGFSCFKSFRGQAAAAAHFPSAQFSGRHWLKSTSAILPAIANSLSGARF